MIKELLLKMKGFNSLTLSRKNLDDCLDFLDFLAYWNDAPGQLKANKGKVDIMPLEELASDIALIQAILERCIELGGNSIPFRFENRKISFVKLIEIFNMENKYTFTIW